MAKVIKYEDGFNHLESDYVTTIETLCGICDDTENRSIGEVFEGKVTCSACRAVARAVFTACKKSEVL